MSSIAGCLLFVGMFFIFTSTLGLVRFNDFYSKVHAVGVSDTAGTCFLLLGVALYIMPSWIYLLKVVLLISIVWITSVMASVTLARFESFNRK